MAPLGPRRARQLGVEIDEHGAGDVAGVVVGAAGRTAQPPPHVEHHGRFALRQQRGQPLCCVIGEMAGDGDALTPTSCLPSPAFTAAAGG